MTRFTRALAPAFAAALVFAGSAHADTKTPTTTQGCTIAFDGATGLHYKVGDTIWGYDNNGRLRKFRCNADGKWEPAREVVRGEVIAPIGGTLELSPTGELAVIPGPVRG